MDLSIFIVTNGPGELSAWVRPVVDRLRSHLPDARIVIALVPCPHSSGYEEKVASQIYGSLVLKPDETIRFILSGKLPSHVIPAREGLILHLGGDQLFALGMGWRTRFPVVVYSENKILWPRWVDRYLLRDADSLVHHRKKGLPEQKLKVVGDLMADAVRPNLTPMEARKKLKLKPDAPVVSLLPGSKPLKVLHTAAFMLKIADEIRTIVPETQFILLQSPFTPLAQIREAIQETSYLKVLDGAYGKIMHDNNGTFILTRKGSRINIVPPSWHYNALQVSDVSLALPGTNTAELGILGIPMVVMLPLNKPEVIPIDGLLGTLCQGLLGHLIKPLVIQLLLRQLKYVAIPNQKAQRRIVPEMIGHISAKSVAQTASNLLRDNYQRRQIALALRQAMASEDATQQLVRNLVEVLEEHYPHFKDVFVQYRTLQLREQNLDTDRASNEEQEQSQE